MKDLPEVVLGPRYYSAVLNTQQNRVLILGDSLANQRKSYVNISLQNNSVLFILFFYLRVSM